MGERGGEHVIASMSGPLLHQRVARRGHAQEGCRQWREHQHLVTATLAICQVVIGLSPLGRIECAGYVGAETMPNLVMRRHEK
jgi:hypothetical protein